MSEFCCLRQSEGYEARDDDKQEKAPALLLRRRGHNRPQCGRFQRRELTLFYRLTFLIDADFRKSKGKSHCFKISNNAIAEKGGFTHERREKSPHRLADG